MFKKKGITLKTFIFTSALITVIVAVSFGILYFTLPGFYFNAKSKSLQKNAGVFEQSLKQAATQEECVGLIKAFSLANNAFVISYDKENVFIPDLSSPLIMMGENKGFRIILNTKGEVQDNKEKYVIEAPKTDNVLFSYQNGNNITFTKSIGNSLIDHILISGTLQPIDEAKNVIISLMPYLLVLDILIALLAAFFYAKRLTRPILAISQAAAAMQRMTPDVLSNIKTQDELGELSQNLDSMYLSLCENIKNLKHEMETVQKLEQLKADFMRAAGHELKTPVAALNGIVEGMIDNVGKYKDKDKYLLESKLLIDKLSSLINEILVASNMDKTKSAPQFERIGISDLLSKVIGEYSILIEEKQLQISIEESDFIICTDEKLLSGVLSNILSNAVKHTLDGGKINISLSVNGDHAVLSIENQCGTIDAEELPKLFEPFYTLSYSRDRRKSGTGLGLYIVRKNLEQLQIAYKLENTELGLKFSLFL